tara:strand:+ start:423 stop:596 length:174 start_codon:yes stop_codon:yes gene_type:complete
LCLHINEKFIQNIVAPYVVKKLPDGNIGSIVAIINRVADRAAISFFVLYIKKPLKIV